MTEAARGRVVGPAGVAVLVCGFLGLAALQYAMPSSIVYPGSINPPGAREFAAWLGVGVRTPLGAESFAWVFRTLVVALWIGYGLVLYAGFRRGIKRPMAVLGVAAGLAVVLAVVFPPSLSHDLFAYLGYGRMGVLYGLNPYVHTLEEMAARGDVVALWNPAPTASMYGPVWTLLSSGIVAAFRGFGLPVQLVALKLVEAAALVGGALAARSIARVWDPRHADLALVAFALNPLLMLEGPCNGHNDVLMVALMLAGIALTMRPSWQLGYVVLGLSVGVKYVSLAIVPWLIIEQVRRMPRRRALGRAAAAGGLVLAPVACALVPFWTGLGTLSGVGAMYAKRSPGDLLALAGVAAVVVLYAAATVWVWRGEGDRVAPAWTVWSSAGILLAIPGILPWYMAWPTSVTLTRWDRRQQFLTAACMALSLYWMLHYAVLRPG